jgi:hypothetical protein
LFARALAPRADSTVRASAPARTSPFARAFFTLVEELGVVEAA